MAWPRELARAQLRALVLLALVLDVPLLARLVELLTRAPAVEVTEIDGVPVEIVRPAGHGPWATWVFVTGAHPLRRREPVVRRLTRGLARAGFLVVAPDPPGLGDGRVTTETLEASVGVIEHAAGLPDARAGRVALLGTSMGAGLVVLSAARPSLAGRVSMVAAVAPYADIERLVCVATTGCYEVDGRLARHPVTPLHRRVVARSLAGGLGPGPDRDVLLARLDGLEEDGQCSLGRLSADGVGAEARSVVEVLANDDPERFPALYAALPAGLRASLRGLSPVWTAGQVRSPVELVVPPRDDYFPLGEALALARALPTARLTVTGALDHTRPRASLAGVADFVRFVRFVVRALAGAAAP